MATGAIASGNRGMLLRVRIQIGLHVDDRFTLLVFLLFRMAVEAKIGYRLAEKAFLGRDMAVVAVEASFFVRNRIVRNLGGQERLDGIVAGNAEILCLVF